MKDEDDSATLKARKDILLERPKSVLSKRRIEEIIKDPGNIWNSRRKNEGRQGESKGNAWTEPSRVPGVKKVPLPTAVHFQLATLTDDPPIGDEWLHEIKLDGYRLQCRLRKATARLLTRTGQDWTDRFPRIASTLAELPVQTAILDGEIVALTSDGRSSFHLLQQSLSEGKTDALVYCVFDLLYVNGFDLRRVALDSRKNLLKQVVSMTSGRTGTIRYSDHVVGGGPEFFQEACRLGLEGMISKRRHAPYREGRSHDWIKVKCLQRQEFVVGGFTEPSGSRSGLGALLLGVYAGSHLQYAGRVGTGFNDRSLKQLRTRLDRLKRDRSPFQSGVPGPWRGITWAQPELIVEVAFSEWTADGHLRHPSFQGIREDKKPREIRREHPTSTQLEDAGEPVEKGTRGTAALSRSSGHRMIRRNRTDRRDESVEIAGVRLTHPERILYPDQGLTKRDVATYYESIADWILPHIAGRPLMVVRCPEGHTKECFYQKHANEAVPASVKAVTIQEDEKSVRYLMVDDLPGLMTLVQMGVLELHVWGARADRIETPDRMIFDLDPDEKLPWPRVVQAAKLIRERLVQLGLASWVKTTGGKGLHVVVPLTGKQGWDEVKGFAQALAENVAKEAPDQYTSKMSKAGRTGKIFIDYVRNGRGATAVAAYSTRARSGATVSVPVSWEELSRVTPARFTVNTVPQRFLAVKHDPWAELWNTRQSITRTARRSLGLP